MLSDLVAEYGRRRAWLILAPILWLGCTALATAQTPSAPTGYPPFSWDTVPIAADFGKAPDQFTQEEGLFIARHFSLVSIGKGQAVGPFTKRPPYTEAGFLDAVPLIKLNNSKVKILFYWNTQIAFFSGVCAPLYTAFSVGYSPQWCEQSKDSAKWEWPCGSSTTTTACVMAGDSGSAQYSPMYNLTNSAFQQWWVTWAQGIVTGLYRPSPLTADGVFADHAPASPPLYSQASAMYQTLAGALPADFPPVYNGIQCGKAIGTVCPLLTGSLQYLKSAFITGAMIEHFGLIGQEITTTEPQQAVMNALLDLQPTTPPKINPVQRLAADVFVANLGKVTNDICGAGQRGADADHLSTRLFPCGGTTILVLRLFVGLRGAGRWCIDISDGRRRGPKATACTRSFLVSGILQEFRGADRSCHDEL